MTAERASRKASRLGLGRSEWRLIAGAGVLTVLSGAFRYVPGVPPVAAFAVSAVGLALLAALVARSVGALGSRLGVAATGAIQGSLGNLPELFFAIFALRSGLVRVVQAALIGSVLSNVLLVLGVAFIVGGLRHGIQEFQARPPRTLSLLLVLAVAVIVVPSLASRLAIPTAHHEDALSTVAAVVLLVVYALSLFGSLRERSSQPREPREPDEGRWPLPVALGVLALASGGAALVSDWFVHALQPAIHTLGISQAFAGLVIVAIAGNAIENYVGIQLAARNEMDLSLSVILQSPLQIALVLIPVLVLVSPVVGTTGMTLVFPPLLLVSLGLGTVVTAFVVADGDATWMEGATLVGLYVLIAAAYWWG